MKILVLIGIILIALSGLLQLYNSGFERGYAKGKKDEQADWVWAGKNSYIHQVEDGLAYKLTIFPFGE